MILKRDRRGCGILKIACMTIFSAVSVCPTREIQATEGEVTSPNHPSNYPSNVDCTLAIDGGENVKFKLKFDFFELEEDEDGKCVKN